MDKLQKLIKEYEVRTKALESRNFNEESEHCRFIWEALKLLKEIQDSGSCNECRHKSVCLICPKPGAIVRYNCGFFLEKKNEGGDLMAANDRQVTGKLNEEPKDSHAEYWNSIGEWKEGEAE